MSAKGEWTHLQVVSVSLTLSLQLLAVNTIMAHDADSVFAAASCSGDASGVSFALKLPQRPSQGIITPCGGIVMVAAPAGPSWCTLRRVRRALLLALAVPPGRISPSAPARMATLLRLLRSMHRVWGGSVSWWGWNHDPVQT